ncbi:phage tail protein [Aeromonas allosaccharophila]|uniref:phage tail protein n=1 Tax=Aeromonas allosaccharophila TaxID=656 RepID=UPI000DCF7C2E|nr:phage tail protein [Aeromonas allosaccharophila]
MEKPKQIREVLTRCVQHLNTNPDKLHIFIAPGNIESTGARSLSFEWQYPLTIGIEDFAGHPDQIMVPLLAWLRQHQPELMTNDEQRKDGITFEAEYLANDLMDLIITVKLTERVKVWQNELGIGWEHLPEPPEDPYDGITWELFINGEPQPWPPTT